MHDPLPIFILLLQPPSQHSSQFNVSTQTFSAGIVTGAHHRGQALVSLCFFVSGFAALIYQTAWTRQFAFVFGTSELAIATVLAEDGHEISDDAVNFHGGDPGDYYGTEIDVQLQWIYQERFHFTLEGAVLLPGSSLKDEHGHAVNSFLVESRFLYVF